MGEDINVSQPQTTAEYIKKEVEETVTSQVQDGVNPFENNGAKNGYIDIKGLNADLFKGILKNSGVKDAEISKIPADKLAELDIKCASAYVNEYRQIL